MAFVKRGAKITIDIEDGPYCNVFEIIGLANKLAKKVGLDHKAICMEMTSGNYDHLIKTFDHYFGHFVDIVGHQEKGEQ